MSKIIEYPNCVGLHSLLGINPRPSAYPITGGNYFCLSELRTKDEYLEAENSRTSQDSQIRVTNMCYENFVEFNRRFQLGKTIKIKLLEGKTFDGKGYYDEGNFFR